MIIAPEEPRHAAAIETLLDIAFGPDRHRKTSYKLRVDVAPLAELCLVATDVTEDGDEVLLGTIRYWPVLIGDRTPTLLLGPIAVAPALQGCGLGSKLIRISLDKAAALGHRSVVLVGDAPYYARFGFSRRLTEGLRMPGPVDLERFLGLELIEGALSGAAGMLTRVADHPSTPISQPAAPIATPLVPPSILRRYAQPA